MALSPQFVNAKDLRKAIGELNATGLIDPKIRTVGVKKEAMVKSFMDAVQKIPEADENKIAESTIAFYNSIVEGKDPSPEELKKQAATKKAAVPRGPSNEQKAYDLMKAGATEDQWTKTFGDYYAAKGVKDEKFFAKRIAIYKNIAKKRLAAEGTPVAEEKKEAPPETAETPETQTESEATEAA